jgi:HK97 family phage prohead protease
MKMKFMNLPLEVKETGEEGYIEGYASVFGVIDSYGDVVDPGAFKKSIKESKGRFPILSNHRSDQQIGWNIEAVEDSKGLLVKGWLDTENNAKAREHYSLIKKAIELKAKAGLSIGYYTIKAEPDKSNPTVRRLKELRLVEYSPVAFPANTEASAIAAKEDGIKTLEEYFEKMKQDGFEFQEIKNFFSALRDGEAANLPNNPQDLQLVETAVKQLSTILKGE